jgi:transcriptional regulator with XRE-family HTH domain
MDAKSLKEMRNRAGLSQWRVAVACNRTQGWLSNIELGYVKPTDEDILKIAAAIKTLQSSNPKTGAECVAAC